MARRVRTLPIASGAGKQPKFEIGTTDWPQIESEYGHALPQNTRVEIIKLTKSFLYFAPFETTAEPLKPASDMAKAWKQGAANLRRTLFERGGNAAARIFAKSRVEMHFNDARFRQPHLFEALGGVLGNFVGACDKALADMDVPEAPDHRQGECWENWVRDLTRSLDKVGLPTGARNDSADLAKESPFTNLVDALQRFVPAEFRRSTQSLSALAKAIQRARDNNATRDE